MFFRIVQLNEMRALRNPPKLVQLTMEAVCGLLGHKGTDWDEIRKIIRNDSFIKDVLEFDSTTVRPKLLEDIARKFKTDASTTVDQVPPPFIDAFLCILFKKIRCVSVSGVLRIEGVRAALPVGDVPHRKGLEDSLVEYLSRATQVFSCPFVPCLWID